MGWFSSSDDGFFLATIVPTGDGARVDKFLGVVNGEAIIGANIFRDLFSSVRSFQLVSLLQAATALAALNDGPGAALCADWRAGLAVGGPMEQNLPRAIEAARKLVPAVR